MGDNSKTVSEDDMDKASELRSQAAGAYSEQEYDKAINFYTEAIKANPHNALFFAKRGQVCYLFCAKQAYKKINLITVLSFQAFLKLTKPNACIRDCNRALELNCDSAAAYKFRGRANRLLGNWEDSARDLRQACKLDFDEETNEWLKEVTPNAKKLEQHKIKQERKQKEKELRAKQERIRKAQEANRRANEEREASAGAMPGGFPGGGMPSDFMGKNGGGVDFMNDFNDPEVMAALTDIISNPGNIGKYKDNPKIMKLIAMVQSQTAAGGFPGMGGMPGFGGAAGAGFGGETDSEFGGSKDNKDDKPKSNLQDEDLD